jgi:2-octaprenyl-6-methoxyphenol hydroxylase
LSRTFDIVIVGGGMVGASLAAALAPLPLRIAVVEAWSPSSSAQPSYDDRSTAVSEGSRRIFDTVGCWGAIEPEATAIRRIHVSDRGQFGFARLDCRDYDVPALGYVVENRCLGAALWKILRKHDRISTICPARLGSLEIDADGAALEIRHDGGESESLRAALVVGADGAQSVVRASIGLGEVTWEYGQEALIANVSISRFHENEAYERFTETGPLALLPMTGDRCSLVWTLDPERAAALAENEEGAFLSELQTAFGFRLGRFTRVGRRARYPLRLIRARRQSDLRVVLIGNAAHSIHPVAGQGFNLGLRDVAALADVIADAVGAGTDPGAASVLEAYAEWRAADQRRVAAMTDSLARLFTNPLAPVGAARRLGLLGLDLVPAPKKALARQAMGIRGRLPRLARGIPLS